MKGFLERWLTPTPDAPSQADEMQEVEAADNFSDQVFSANYSEEIQLLKIPDDETAWRVQAMLPQIPDSGPVPFLIARKEVDSGPGKCPCCGDDLDAASGFRCGACSRAVNLALEIALARKPVPGNGESIE